MAFPLAFLSTPGPMEMLVIGVIAVLLFGKRLPEVGRSLGKGLVEFKKGIHGIEEEFRSASSSVTSSSPSASSAPSSASTLDRDEASAPKFVPPTEGNSESPQG